MGFADSMTTMLFLNRRQSDIEFKLGAIMNRKMAIMDEANEISELLAATIFQSDETGQISPALPLPGTTPQYPIVPLPGPATVPTGLYEEQLAVLQGIEKELDTKQKKLETELEAVKAERESMKKIADDHAKKDFKIGG